MTDDGLTTQESKALDFFRSNDPRATAALMALDDAGRVRVLARMTSVSTRRDPSVSQDTSARDSPDAGGLSDTADEPTGAEPGAGHPIASRYEERTSGRHAPASPSPRRDVGSPHRSFDSSLPPQAATPGNVFRTGGSAILATGRRVELAHPGARFVARLIDGLVLSPLWIIAIVGRPSSIGAAIAMMMLITGGAYMYEVFMLTNKGQTVGKMAMSIRVVGDDDGTLPDGSMTTKRWLVPNAAYFLPFVLLAFLPLVSLEGAVIIVLLLMFLLFVALVMNTLVYVSSLWDSTRQGWHDKLAGTLVIMVSKGSPRPRTHGEPVEQRGRTSNAQGSAATRRAAARRGLV